MCPASHLQILGCGRIAAMICNDCELYRNKNILPENRFKWCDRQKVQGGSRMRRQVSFLLILLLVLPSLAPFMSPVASRAAGEGLWKLVSVDTEQAAADADRTPSIGQSGGTLSVVSADTGDRFKASMNWTAPLQAYGPDDPVEITLTATVDEYVWNGKNGSLYQIRPIIILAVCLVVGIFITVLVLLIRRKRRAPAKAMNTASANFRYCRHCGSPNGSNAGFCRSCGKPLT